MPQEFMSILAHGHQPSGCGVRDQRRDLGDQSGGASSPVQETKMHRAVVRTKTFSFLVVGKHGLWITLLLSRVALSRHSSSTSTPLRNLGMMLSPQ